MRVVGDAELVGDGQRQRVGFRDRLVLPQFFDELVRLAGVAASEHGAGLLVDEADLIGLGARPAEIGAVAVVLSAKMLRLTDTRGSRACPVAVQASR